MSVYLSGTSVLLDGSGNVATDTACCCGEVDCPCGFDAFDGSGRRFLTRTIHTVIDQVVTCPCGVPEDHADWLCVDTYDTECNLSHDVSGGETATPCDSPPFHPGERCACFGDVISATELHFTLHVDFDCEGGPGTLDEDVTCILSDECNPV